MRKVKQMLHRHHNTGAANTTTTSSTAYNSGLANSTGFVDNSGLANSGYNSGLGSSTGFVDNSGFANSGLTNTGLGSSSGFGSSSYSHPFASQYNLPSEVLNWQTGQPIPQGWRLGRRGYLKPAWTLPSHLSSWQTGQPIPEGYRLNKRGGLRPVNIWSQWSTTSSSTAFTNVLPAQVEIRERAAVVQEVIKPGVREEIQPVIHREREQLEIREEIQPIYEKAVQPTMVEQRQLAPEIRPEVRVGQMPILAEGPRSGVVVEAEQRSAVVMNPIVEETVHRKVIEEIQPVIHREVIAPKVIQETQPIFEKIVEAPVVTYSTLAPRFVGTDAGLATTGLNTGMATQTTTTTMTTESEFVPYKRAPDTTFAQPSPVQKF